VSAGDGLVRRRASRRLRVLALRIIVILQSLAAFVLAYLPFDAGDEQGC
jgi:hypothetical protein